MRALLLSAVAVLLGSFAFAKGERSGEFDYYVLSLSWAPTWCAIEGDARQSPQCEADFGWVMHGLWPQYYRGWPSYCPTTERNPSRSMTRDMADVMGTSGLAWHQWNKHGVCSGLTASDYYALAREACKGGQKAFQIQAYPFRMTAENMAKHKDHKHFEFWKMLKRGYDHFEITSVPPKVDVCE